MAATRSSASYWRSAFCRRYPKPYHVLGHALSVSASIGIVKAPEDGKTADELLKKADIALYNVKSRGRKGFEIYRSGAGQEADIQRRLELDIHSALSENQFELHYQPILSLKTRHVFGCEALLRWRHPDHGLIAPADFLTIAERTGAIVEIGGWVLAQACRDAARWPDGVKVTVNLSSLQLENGDLGGMISRALADAKIEAGRLDLEVAEAVVSREGTRCAMCSRVCASSVSASPSMISARPAARLSQLQCFQFDRVKIDRELVRNLPARANSAAIVKAVAMLAQMLGISTVAEGVETLDELNFVATAGCTKVQGYYFSRPVPACELGAVLSLCPQKFAVAA